MISLSSYRKTGNSWSLPRAEQIIDDLRTHGGSPLSLAQSVAEPADCSSLLFAIGELLAEPENEQHLIAWNKLCGLGRAIAVEIGSDRLLQRYASGELPKNASFLYRLVSDIRASSPSKDHTEAPTSEADEMIARLLRGADEE